MTTLRTAAQQALDALVSQFDGRADAMNILSAALAQEPTPPPEARTEAEKTAYAAGWWDALRKAQQAEPLGWAVQIGTHSAGRRQGKPRYVLFFNKADAEDLADRTRGARPEPFYSEGQPSRTVPVYTAPPQRRPLTDEENPSFG